MDYNIILDAVSDLLETIHCNDTLWDSLDRSITKLIYDSLTWIRDADHGLSPIIKVSVGGFKTIKAREKQKELIIRANTGNWRSVKTTYSKKPVDLTTKEVKTKKGNFTENEFKQNISVKEQVSTLEVKTDSTVAISTDGDKLNLSTNIILTQSMLMDLINKERFAIEDPAMRLVEKEKELGKVKLEIIDLKHSLAVSNNDLAKSSINLKECNTECEKLKRDVCTLTQALDERRKLDVSLVKNQDIIVDTKESSTNEDAIQVGSHNIQSGKSLKLMNNSELIKEHQILFSQVSIWVSKVKKIKDTIVNIEENLRMVPKTTETMRIFEETHKIKKLIDK
jgi:hypothetical protein